MDLVYIAAILAACSFVVYLVCSILMVNFLEKRKIKINYWLIRILIWKYVNQYRDITLKETGKIGTLHTIWSISLFLMIASAFGTVFIKKYL
jgi:hypothetical protein